MRYANLKARGSGVVEAANKVLVNQRMKLERRRRSERPHLQGVVGPFRHRVAGDDRAARTTA